ncbi:hypothetical protein NDU88_011666 [Pleurodeles waltl]|uniref:Uncharacterized protein n=1 Tax=Pleurodeles waltl TaxID=8319 RepID=A0AAV7QXZ5_PLEWA|nr:hypothetical protein NDU88_011666 [Pleurodeles waltl]
MALKDSSPSKAAVGSLPVPITQDYMDQFLKDIRSKIGSLMSDFQSCLQNMRQDISEIGEHVDDLECTADSTAEDQAVLWRRVDTLEEQQDAKDEDIMNFTAELLQMI